MSTDIDANHNVLATVYNQEMVPLICFTYWLA